MSKESISRMMGGSLVRRTVFAIGALLLGSSLFIGLLSLVLVSTVEAMLPPNASAAGGDEPSAVDVADLADGPAKSQGARSLRPKRTGSVSDKAPGEADR